MSDHLAESSNISFLDRSIQRAAHDIIAINLGMELLLEVNGSAQRLIDRAGNWNLLHFAYFVNVADAISERGRSNVTAPA